MSEHVEVDRLRDFARGVLIEVEAGAVLDHCWTCKECGDRLAVVLALLEADARERAGRTRRRGLIAAAVVVALLAGVLWRAGLLPAAGADLQAVNEATSFAAPSALARLATQSPPPRALVAFLYEFPGAMGEPPQTSTADYALSKRRGLELIVEHRYADAVEALDRLIAQHPEDPELAAYLGIGLYLRGDGNEEVATLLARGVRSRPEALANTSAWYLANHYVRAGDRGKAEIVLEELAGKREEDESVRAAAQLLHRLQETK